MRVVLALCALWLTIFIAWFIYYMAMIMRQMFLGVKEMRERVHRVDELIESVKEKIEHSTSYLMLIGEGVKKLVEVVKEYSGKVPQGTKKKN